MLEERRCDGSSTGSFPWSLIRDTVCGYKVGKKRREKRDRKREKLIVREVQ